MMYQQRIDQQIMGNLFLGCCGWNYPDTPDKGGWTEASSLQVLRLLILRTLNNFWIGCRLAIAMITQLNLDILPGALKAPGKCSGITILQP